MSNIVDFIMRKVSETLLFMEVMNKNVFQVATQQQKGAKSDFLSFEYKRSLVKQAENFWDEVIAMQQPYMKKAVRWDIFEENFISLLLEKMNFSNDLLNKIQWKQLLELILEKCGDTYKENNEVPEPPSNPKLLPYFKGLHVTKERFL